VECKPTLHVRLKDGGVFDSGMTVLVDIGCPDCGRTEPVRKVGIGRYRCEECGRVFTESEVRGDG
jgi:predicted  nucleic acid-binding Zn-ribbon protein